MGHEEKGNAILDTSSKRMHEEVIAQVIMQLVLDPPGEEGLMVWVRDRLGLKDFEAVQVVSDPVFVEQYYTVQKVMARAEFSRIAYETLMKIVKEGSEAQKIRAIRTLNEMFEIGDRGSGGGPSFEDLLNQAKKIGGSEKKKSFPGL